MIRSVATVATVIAAVAIGGCCPTPPRAATTPVATPTPVEPPVVEPPPPPPDPWAQAGVDWTTPPAPLTDPGFTPPVPTEFTLANGIRVLVVENPRLPLVSVRIAVRGAGSRADGGKAGLAALTADLLDEGAGRWSSEALPEELERLGADLSIAAGQDYAQLTLDTLAETLAPSLDVAAAVLTKPTISTADFARVKAEHLADLALRPDQPRAIAAVAFARRIYGDHPYGAPGDGYAATVGKLQKPDVVRFFRDRFGPSATTIVVVGDITAARARAELERTLGRWNRKVAAVATPAAPRPTTPEIAFIDRPGAPQSVIAMGRLGPTMADPQLPANDLVNLAIGGSFASRLNTELREKKGYTYGISSTFVRGEWAGAWRVGSSIRTDATGPALRDIRTILEGARTPMPAAELAKAKALMIRSLPQDFETNAGIANQYLGAALERRPLTYYRELPARLEAVTAEQAAAAAAAAWGDLSIVIVGDWAAVGADVESLGLPVVRLDADGAPIK